MSCPDTYVLRKDLEPKEAPKGKCDFNAMERPLASVQDCITKAPYERGAMNVHVTGWGARCGLERRLHNKG